MELPTTDTASAGSPRDGTPKRRQTSMMMQMKAAKQMVSGRSDRFRLFKEPPPEDAALSEEGYGHDFVMVFEHEAGATELSPAVAEIVAKVTATGLEVLCIETTSREHVLVKLRAPLALLKRFAEQVEYEFELVPDEIEQRAASHTPRAQGVDDGDLCARARRRGSGGRTRRASISTGAASWRGAEVAGAVAVARARARERSRPALSGPERAREGADGSLEGRR